MDLVFFIKERLKFATYFFENATKPFSGLISAIEKEEPPFVPVYDESGEPQYLQEWQDARTGFESVGLTALSMVASSLQLFLNDWVRFRLESRGEPPYKRKHKKGWFYAYRKILEEVGLDVTACPANLELIEQAVLARNRGQHPEMLTMLQTTHSKSDLEKYPNPYFMSETDQRVIELDNGELSWWLSPNVFVDESRLSTVISEVEKLCEWLEEEY
ncbi:hypothetical protein I6M54_07000 [Shewanella algae]|uniref:Uncharacterized protein n=1 Tax=Shewanella algae TaxID=38313 RepID=A0AAD1K855_9GAMM|nr:hypothetical protein [Shewanella algae]MBO2594586.1 hypothetical protein [Shewanella algae]MBO2665942.1 hypothetical protein [Shewanella algae]BCV44365.1 hypothetical protein TUM17379_13830 [Shewanella algae]